MPLSPAAQSPEGGAETLKTLHFSCFAILLMFPLRLPSGCLSAGCTAEQRYALSWAYFYMNMFMTANATGFLTENVLKQLLSIRFFPFSFKENLLLTYL